MTSQVFRAATRIPGMDAMKVHAPLLVTLNTVTSSPQDRGLTDL